MPIRHGLRLLLVVFDRRKLTKWVSKQREIGVCHAQTRLQNNVFTEFTKVNFDVQTCVMCNDKKKPCKVYRTFKTVQNMCCTPFNTVTHYGQFKINVQNRFLALSV